MTGEIGIGYVDYSGEKSHSRAAVPGFTAGNIVAQNALIDTLFSAIDGLSMGARVFQERSIERTTLSPTLPTDANAQRELKWLVTYKDNTTSKKYHFTIPCAWLVISGVSQLLPGTDKADLTKAAWSSFKSAFEGVVVSPAGNAVTVLEAHVVGRSI